MPRQVRRRAANDPPVRRELHGDEIRIDDAADSYPHVVTLLDEVYDLVRQVERDANLRMACDE